MKYEVIDPVIADWVKRHCLVLHTIYQDCEVRSVDIVDSKGKRYQLWIDLPADEKVSVHAWDFKKRKRNWRAKIEDLKDCLEEALDIVKGWFDK